MTDIVVTRNDTKFDLEFEITDADGEPVTLVDATVTFKMAIRGEVSCQICDTCDITEPASDGKCTYTIKDGDLDTADCYDSELEIVYIGGKKITGVGPQIIVKEDLPAT